MNNIIYDNNLNALEERLHGWKAYIVNKEYKKVAKELKEEGINDFIASPVRISDELAYNGENIFKVKYKGNEYYLAGRYNPEKMAEYRAGKIEDTGFGSIAFIVGFSDGKMLKQLMSRLSEEMTVIVYEPSIDIFINALQNEDITSLFEGNMPGLIIDGINNQELDNIINSRINTESLAKIKIYISPNYDKLFPLQTKKFLDKVNKRVSSVKVNWNTMLNFSDTTIFNEMRNIMMVYNHYNLADFFKTIPDGVPAIVVAAGPSLDKNIDLLKKARGKACIIACDTALKPLFRHGITPDYFVVVDPRKPIELFEMKKTHEVPMISGINVPHQLMREHQGEKILYYDSALQKMVYETVLDKKNGKHNGMLAVSTGGSVATSAFSIAGYMGAKTIILVGQDLALTGEKEHASGTFKNDWKHDINSGRYIQVEAIDGGKVSTLPNLNMYRKWFEDQIESAKGAVRVIDATEGGALIHGTEIMSLESAINENCNVRYNRKKVLGNVKPHFDDAEQKKALIFYKNLPTRLDKFEREVDRGIKLYDRLNKLVNRKNYSDEELKRLLDKIGKFNKKMNSDDFAMFISDGLVGVEYTLLSSVYNLKEDERTELTESAEIGKVYLNSMKVVINEIRPIAKENEIIATELYESIQKGEQ